MDTIDVTCQCGRRSRAPASSAGKAGRCRGCGARILIPGVAAQVAQPATLSAVPPEPWYYGFMVGFAGAAVFLATSFFLWIGYRSVVVYVSLRDAYPQAAFWLPAFVLAIATAILVPTVVIGIPALVFVDVARNVRAIRYARESE